MRATTRAVAAASLLLVACGGEGGMEPAGTRPAENAPSASPSRAEQAGSPREELLQMAARLEQSDNDWVGTARNERLRTFLAQDPADVPPADLRRLWTDLAQRLLLGGEVEEAVAILERQTAATRAGSQAALQLHRQLGIAYLRQAEVENCIQRHNADCCIFPLAGAGVHEAQEPAEKAYAAFSAFLAERPQNLKVLWLLNVTAMALGRYPDGVPSEQLIPASAFASAADPGRFRDVAPRLGVDTFNRCGGVSVEDFDRDGDLDLLTSTYDPRGELRFFRNERAAGFADASQASGAAEQLGGFNLVAGDVDGDGDRDVLLLRGAWLRTDGRLRNSLLVNELPDGGGFRDVTRAVGLAEPAYPTQTAAFGDFDDDGRLDLFVGNESLRDADPAQDFPSQLFRNATSASDGAGLRFVDVAAGAGVTNDRYCKGLTAGDFDNDGDLDIYLSNFGPNRLYENGGDLRFRDVAPERGVTAPTERSFATWFFDQDEDGWLDLFVTSYAGSIADLAAELLGKERASPRPWLYRNERGRFRDVAADVGLDRFFLPMGANFGDLDNDGWLDVYLTTGDPQLESILPNAMLKNDGGRTFLDVTTATGLGHLQKGHGVAFCDLDQDGDQDLYHQLGGFVHGDRFHNALFENPGQGNRFLHVDLVGTTVNRDAIGARVRVTVRTPDGERTIHRAVGSVSSFGGSPLRQEIGLGRAVAIERLEVRWPGPEGRTQVFRDVPLDALVRVTEGASELERRPHASFRF